MMRDAKLGLRLIAGAGTRDILRIALMVVGLAVSIASMLLCLAVPTALSHAQSIENARTPNSSNAPGAAYTYRLSRQAETKPWTSIEVGGDLSALQPPPGLTSWPAPGHSLVSPALKEIIEREPIVGFQLGVVDTATITSDGLVSPAELYSYTNAGTKVNGQTVISFGNPGGYGSLPSNTTLTYGSLALFTFAPALLFATICLRFSARSRQTRYQRLVKLGVSEQRCGNIFACEMTAVSVTALALAFILFGSTQAIIGAHAWLGVSWWPTQALLPPLAYIIGSLVTLAVLHTASARSMKRALHAAARPSREFRYITYARIVLGSVALLGTCGFLATVTSYLLTKPDDYMASENFIVYSMAAAIAGLLGVLLLNPYLISGLNRVAEARNRDITFTMGTRLARHHAPRVTMLTAAIACALTVTSFASGMLSAFALDTANDAGWQTIQVSGDMTPSQRKAVMAIDTALIQASYMTPQYQTVHVYNCPSPGTIDKRTELGCRNEPQSGAYPSGLAAELQIPQRDGRVTTVNLPAPRSTYSASIADLKLPLDQGAWILTARDVDFLVYVNTSDTRLPQTMAAIHKIAPEIDLGYDLKNTYGYYDLNAGAGAVRGGTILGFGVLFMSLAFVMVEIRWGMARSIASQQAMGVRARTLRLASMYQLTVPLLIPCLIALAVGSFSAMVCQAVFGRFYMNLGSVALAPSVALVIALIAVTACGYAMGSPKFDRDLLATDA